MAKITLALNDKILQEIQLYKERISIGRSPQNDIVLDNRAISAEHAVIVTVNNDSFLEDLNSTNGTQVNGQPIKKHFLQENDVIALAQYRLRYFSNEDDKNTASENDCHLPAPSKSADNPAVIKILNGPNAGKEKAITKTLTTLGQPKVQVAVITHKPCGYYLAHVEGTRFPTVNGHAIEANTHALVDGDVIDLAGTVMQFSLR